jgi:hypothetical protein
MVMNVDELPNRVAMLSQYLMIKFEFVCQADAGAALAMAGAGLVMEAATRLAMEACMACDNSHGEG